MENKLDRNSIIGIFLMIAMFTVYSMFYTPEPPAKQDVKADSTQVAAKPTGSNTVQTIAPQVADSTQKSLPESEFTLENKDLRVVFSSKGASIKKVYLKKFKTYKDFINKEDKEMLLFDGAKHHLDYKFETQSGLVNLNTIDFSLGGAKNTNSITFQGSIQGATIQRTYSLEAEGYQIKEELSNQNLGQILKNAPVVLNWENEIQVVENDLTENRRATHINYFNSDNDFEAVGRNSVSKDDDTAKKPIKWFTFYQKYFTSGVVFENGMLNNAKFNLDIPENDTTVVKIGKVTAEIASSEFTQNKTKFTYYFGPNELSDLKAVGFDFQKNLYLGYDIVKPINRYVFVPLFTWVESFVSNYGLLIIVVVLIIKLVLTPLIYKSYVSSAKMRVLAPEIKAIKDKVGDDSMKVQQETMKLYQQVGVSPLSGCVPMLLQMPILMSVFFLFPNLVMFRQKSFLWAEDLSTYDNIIHWGFNLPILGNHLSLFVILMTLSSLAFTYYNNQSTPDQPGPIDMKKISYFFPVVFMFVLNSFPAALSFYYLVSNVVTIAQQLIVKRFVDEDKILTILENNKRNYHTRPQKKNKFSEFMEKQMAASEEMKRKSEEVKKTSKGKK